MDVVRLLIDRGADIHVRKDEPLRNASAYGNLDVVRLLIDRGANIHVRDDEALMWASRWGHQEVVRLLLERGNILWESIIDDSKANIACDIYRKPALLPTPANRSVAVSQLFLRKTKNTMIY